MSAYAPAMPDDTTLHELGNLLAVIAGQAEFLLHQEPDADPAQARAALEAIRGAALRARDRLREARGSLAKAATPAPAAPAKVAAVSILLVDDEDEVRDAVAGMLRQAGHRVDTAASGEDGIARSERQRFDCLITDLALPGLNGFTLSRVVKDSHPGVFVIVMTGSGEDFEPALVRASGVDRVLFKPAGRDEILAAVAESHRAAQAGA